MISLEREITIKKDNIMTTSCALVLIKNGKDILCPECREWGKVYHFSWSALVCQSCKESVNKEDWIVEKTV